MNPEIRPTGHITCSSLPRLALCPGSWLLEQQAPASSDESTAEAESGTRIHAALSGAIHPDVLSDDEREIHDACESLTEELLGARIVDARVSAEQRLYLYCGERTMLSGRYDRIYRIRDDTEVLIDYKTGRGDICPAHQNWQMHGLAVLSFYSGVDYQPTRPVEVAIIQPLARQQITRCLYTPTRILSAYGQLIALLKESYDPKALRRPSEEACRYCHAKSICPEALGVLVHLSRVEGAEEKLELLTADDISHMLDACAVAPKIIQAIRSEARRRIEAGEKFGWHMKPGVDRESISDISTVYARCCQLCVTEKEFTAACSITKKELKVLLRKATGDKGMPLDLRVKQVLEGCTEIKRTEPSLERDANDAMLYDQR